MPPGSRSRHRRRLRGDANGRFRTRGRHSAATVRGTKWTVTDRCDGTLTKVRRGTVAVRDFRLQKNDHPDPRRELPRPGRDRIRRCSARPSTSSPSRARSSSSSRGGGKFARASQKGATFIPLSEARQIPMRVARSTPARARSGWTTREPRRQDPGGVFSAGVFQVLQSRDRDARGPHRVAAEGDRATSTAARPPAAAGGEPAPGPALRRAADPPPSRQRPWALPYPRAPLRRHRARHDLDRHRPLRRHPHHSEARQGRRARLPPQEDHHREGTARATSHFFFFFFDNGGETQTHALPAGSPAGSSRRARAPRQPSISPASPTRWAGLRPRRLRARPSQTLPSLPDCSPTGTFTLQMDAAAGRDAGGLPLQGRRGPHPDRAHQREREHQPISLTEGRYQLEYWSQTIARRGSAGWSPDRDRTRRPDGSQPLGRERSEPGHLRDHRGIASVAVQRRDAAQWPDG